MMDQSSNVGKYTCIIIIINTKNIVNLSLLYITFFLLVDNTTMYMFPQYGQCHLFIPVITVIHKSGPSRYISILLSYHKH